MFLPPKQIRLPIFMFHVAQAMIKSQMRLLKRNKTLLAGKISQAQKNSSVEDTVICLSYLYYPLGQRQILVRYNITSLSQGQSC